MRQCEAAFVITPSSAAVHTNGTDSTKNENESPPEPQPSKKGLDSRIAQKIPTIIETNTNGNASTATRLIHTPATTGAGPPTRRRQQRRGLSRVAQRKPMAYTLMIKVIMGVMNSIATPASSVITTTTIAAIANGNITNTNSKNIKIQLHSVRTT
mmetsp:Transcript_8396/g.19886  ORF Transcript_8396/g.19886 Transcript_8396/m.19886 type:complete len:155 (-) Transcript_8396:321-785(-)